MVFCEQIKFRTHLNYLGSFGNLRRYFNTLETTRSNTIFRNNYYNLIYAKTYLCFHIFTKLHKIVFRQPRIWIVEIKNISG